jgi:hypothetical protein
LSGICGWYGDAGGDAASVIDKMKSRFAWRDSTRGDSVTGVRFALAAVGPKGTAAVFESGPLHLAVQGHPSWSNGARTATRDSSSAVGWSRYLERGGDARIHSGVSLAIIDDRDNQSPSDRPDRRRNIHYQHAGSSLIFGASSDVIAAHPLAGRASLLRRSTICTSTWSGRLRFSRNSGAFADTTFASTVVS